MYYVVYGFLWLLSLLPLRALYVLADGLYALIFYILKYRKQVVMSNLKIAFPEKTEKERTIIAKKFYHNFIDMFVETIKMISASKKLILKRCDANWEIVNQAELIGKSIQVHMSHNFNWEWGNAIATEKVSLPVIAVYMPLGSKIFEKLFFKLRSRYGTNLVRATHMREDFYPYRNQRYILGLVADQNPGHPANAWWINFFGRPTPFVKGPAKGAIVNDTAVVFAYIHKPRRGHYRGVLSIATVNPKEYSEAELTQKYVHYLEDVIKQHPEMWLWSHRRWKHQWKPEYGTVLD
jgi:Kdo2-lipid IVA lauroyltransferase/acyltransferase